MATFEVELTGAKKATVEADRVRNESGFVCFDRRIDKPHGPPSWKVVRQLKAATVLDVRRNDADAAED